MADRRGQAATKELLIDRFRLRREEAEGDLRGRTIMRDANRASTRVRNFHGIPRLRLASIGNVARKNPGVPARNAVGGFTIHANSGQAAILA